ncbi:MAG: SOS response-associated peptidase family protein [Polyangiaceae bacterium]
MVYQSVKSLGIEFHARLQLDLFEELFRRRLVDQSIRIPRALEDQFLEPTTEIEERIQQAILQYRQGLAQQYEAELIKQRERLAEAERKLQVRSTKAAAESKRIATSKIAWVQGKLDDLSRTTTEPRDARIYPLWYAPVVVSVEGERRIYPLRYHCRGSTKPESYDTKYPGLYNARRDNLTGYWRDQFGERHGVMVITAFYENVARHTYEHRQLQPQERESNVVIQFHPDDAAPLPVACLWDEWHGDDGSTLRSFAAITDEPPTEVAETGHDRCPIVLTKPNVATWLEPKGRRDEELFRLLSERAIGTFRHKLAG